MGADADLRAMFSDMPVPVFDTTPFATPPQLAEATVAIVTTAALQRPGDESWTVEDTEFREFGAAERNLIVGNVSMNFDRLGAAADVNVVYPIDRLHELEVDRVIGRVAPRHLSFNGTVPELTTLLLDTGPRAAKVLQADGTDVVLLVPV